MQIRPERPEDHAAIARVVTAAFGSEVEVALVAAIRAGDGYRPDLALVAEEDGEVVGHVMVSGASVDDRPVLTLSPLAVAPAHQRRGIGSALVRAVLARVAGQVVVLEGDPRYYGRFGFEPAAPHGLVIDLPGWAPPEAAQVIGGPVPSGRFRFAALDGLER